MPENTKIKRTVETNTTREYHNQKDFSGVVLLGSVKTKGLPESITDISKVLSENTTINVLHARYHNPKYCQEVPKTKVLHVNVTIKGIPRSIIIKNTATE